MTVDGRYYAIMDLEINAKNMSQKLRLGSAVSGTVLVEHATDTVMKMYG